MLTRCPACDTRFRVTAEQIKARFGRVRCGACQHAFNALDSLIEEPMLVMAAPTPATGLPDPSTLPSLMASGSDIAVLPAPTFSDDAAPAHDFPPMPDATQDIPDLEAPDNHHARADTDGVTAAGIDADTPPNETPPGPAGPLADVESAHSVSVAADTMVTDALKPNGTEPADETAGAEGIEWDEVASAEPSPRRWPWVTGIVLALAALGLQAVLAFRVELAILWPETRPALISLCELTGCEVGLPAKVSLVGIETSDLNPDSEHKGRLALTATLKNRAPFAQEFPHLELTLTDTADKPVARKVLTPADYLSPTTLIAGGMPPNADIAITLGVDSGEMAASGYRLYLFYP